MPIIIAQGKTITCQTDDNLRSILLKNDINPHNGKSRLINCRGLGTCGTCAVAITGEVSPSNWKDTARRSLPPHKLEQNRRLACQTQVLGDIQVQKYNEFWGQGESIVW